MEPTPVSGAAPARGRTQTLTPARTAGGTVALVAVGVVAVSLSGPVMASIAAPALAIAMWRNGLATALLAPAVLLRRRVELARLTRGDLRRTVTAGLFLAAHFGFWVTSLTLTSVAASTALVCTQIGWVVVWDRLSGVRQPWPVAVGLVLAFGGVLVITGVDVSGSGRALLGDLLALVGAVSVAAYTVTGARVRRTVSTTAYTFLCYGTAALALLVAAVAGKQPLVGFDRRSWLLIVLVTLTAQLLGHSVFNLLLDSLSPMLVSLALLLEIPGAALLAAALLGQVPPVGVFVGLGLIVVGIAVVVLQGTGPAVSAPEATAARPG